MALRVRRHPRATTDIDDIWYYIATAGNGPKVANAILEKIDKTVRRLADNPRLGKPRPELGHDLRSVPIDHLILFYREDGVEVVIVRILAAARDSDERDFDD